LNETNILLLLHEFNPPLIVIYLLLLTVWLYQVTWTRCNKNQLTRYHSLLVAMFWCCYVWTNRGKCHISWRGSFVVHCLLKLQWWQHYDFMSVFFSSLPSRSHTIL